MTFAVSYTDAAKVSPSPQSFVHRIARRFLRWEDADRAARDLQRSKERGVMRCNARVEAEDMEAEHELSRRAYFRECFSRVLEDKAEAYDKAKALVEKFDAPVAIAALSVARASWERRPTDAEVLCKVIDDARAEWSARERAKR